MPWTAKDAARFDKDARTQKQKEYWAKIANKQLKNGKSEAEAIRIANSVIRPPSFKKKGAKTPRKNLKTRGLEDDHWSLHKKS